MRSILLETVYFLCQCFGIPQQVRHEMNILNRKVLADNYLVAILLISFLHNVAFTAGTFYLALFFQVRRTVFFFCHINLPIRSL